jgi:hypothetical protein
VTDDEVIRAPAWERSANTAAIGPLRLTSAPRGPCVTLSADATPRFPTFRMRCERSSPP